MTKLNDATVDQIVLKPRGKGVRPGRDEVRRPLIAPEELRQLRDGEALVLYGRLAPIIVRLRMWFADRRLRRLARGEEST